MGKFPAKACCIPLMSCKLKRTALIWKLFDTEGLWSESRTSHVATGGHTRTWVSGKHPNICLFTPSSTSVRSMWTYSERFCSLCDWCGHKLKAQDLLQDTWWCASVTQRVWNKNPLSTKYSQLWNFASTSRVVISLWTGYLINIVIYIWTMITEQSAMWGTKSLCCFLCKRCFLQLINYVSLLYSILCSMHILCYKQILIEKTKLKTLCLNSEQAAIKIKKCCNNIE